jgi:hydrogenase maturation protease
VSAGRVLVAGIGNLFFGDDGFGPAVVAGIADSDLPSTVDVGDYGIRGVHLAYALLDGRWTGVVLVDALPVDGPPGTLAVLEVPREADGGDAVPVLDAHGMDPVAVLDLVRTLGGAVPRVLVVGCRPAVLEERMGLSDAVLDAVDPAVRLVTEVVTGLTAERSGVGAR